MRITNERNLPYALVKAVENDSYNMGSADKSVTGLLQPPRQSALRELHADEVTEDASARVYALYGQLVHSLRNVRASRIAMRSTKSGYTLMSGVGESQARPTV